MIGLLILFGAAAALAIAKGTKHATSVVKKRKAEVKKKPVVKESVKEEAKHGDAPVDPHGAKTEGETKEAKTEDKAKTKDDHGGHGDHPKKTPQEQAREWAWIAFWCVLVWFAVFQVIIPWNKNRVKKDEAELEASLPRNRRVRESVPLTKPGEYTIKLSDDPFVVDLGDNMKIEWNIDTKEMVKIGNEWYEDDPSKNFNYENGPRHFEFKKYPGVTGKVHVKIKPRGES